MRPEKVHRTTVLHRKNTNLHFGCSYLSNADGVEAVLSAPGSAGYYVSEGSCLRLLFRNWPSAACCGTRSTTFDYGPKTLTASQRAW